MKCNMCETGEMQHIQVKRTHIYICEQCPNIQLEYYFNSDIENLQKYLNGELKPLTREEQLKYMLSEHIRFMKYDGNDYDLAYEIKLLMDKGENITSSVTESYKLENEDEIKFVIDTLLELVSQKDKG